MQPNQDKKDLKRRAPYHLISAALTTLLAVAPATPRADDESATRQLVQTECAQCHGEDGNAAAPSFPKLAGLQHDYLVKQMTEFTNNRRQSEIMGP
ncbi:MAG: c-type cytochrome, partial [Thiohalocapsa sp.]